MKHPQEEEKRNLEKRKGGFQLGQSKNENRKQKKREEEKPESPPEGEAEDFKRRKRSWA